MGPGVAGPRRRRRGLRGGGAVPVCGARPARIRQVARGERAHRFRPGADPGRRVSGDAVAVTVGAAQPGFGSRVRTAPEDDRLVQTFVGAATTVLQLDRSSSPADHGSSPLGGPTPRSSCSSAGRSHGRHRPRTPFRPTEAKDLIARTTRGATRPAPTKVCACAYRQSGDWRPPCSGKRRRIRASNAPTWVTSG